MTLMLRLQVMYLLNTNVYVKKSFKQNDVEFIQCDHWLHYNLCRHICCTHTLCTYDSELLYVEQSGFPFGHAQPAL